MAANPYAKEPLCVAQVNPATGKYVRAVFFLGAAPPAVLAAARRGKPRGDPRWSEWAAADAATLRGYYGPQWRAQLSAEDPPPPDPLASNWAALEAFGAAFGADFGADFEPAFAADFAAGPAADPEAEREEGPARPGHGGTTFGGGRRPAAPEPDWGASALLAAGRGGDPLDLGDMRVFDTVGEGDPEAGPGRPRAARAEVEWGRHSAAPPVYSDIAVYPEDTIYDLRLKVGLAAGVPLYRQHFMYYVNEEGPALPYRMALDGVPVVSDWRALAPPLPPGAAGPARRLAGRAAPPAADPGERRPRAKGAAVVAGLGVDPALEERREGIRVEARDTFLRLAPSPGIRVTRAYFVDLYAVLPPLGAPERPADSLGAVLRDRYQFDLLYYGAILRYWPQLSPDACSVALSQPAQVHRSYPQLDPDPEELRGRFGEEKAVAELAAGWRPASAKDAAAAVTAATVRVAPTAVQVRVNIRNIFDWLPTGGGLAAAVANFEVSAEAGGGGGGGGPARRGAVGVVAAKRHVSSYGPRAAPAVDRFVGHALRRGVAAFMLERKAGPAPLYRGKQPEKYVYLVVREDGRYEAAADWREDDRVGFGAVAEELGAAVGPTVAAVNAMGGAAFPIGGELAPMGGGGGAPAALGAITASAFWPHPLTAAAFREVKVRFRRYEKAGVVGVRGLQQGGAFVVSFRKGVVAYDPRLADAAAADGPPGVRARGAMQNQYAWLTDAGAGARWAQAFPGRTVKIFHRATDVKVEVVQADSLAEFELIRRYLFSFFDGLVAGPSRLAEAKALRGEAPGGEFGATGRLRRLQEQDPELYDLKKHDPAATVYSVLCQSGRQPRAYMDAEEAEAAAKKGRRPAAPVRYWNFTEGVPAYYVCPDPRYPHLSFRAGPQHPRGYCLPCCKKARPPPGSRAAAANSACLAAVPGAAAAPPEEEAPDPDAESRHTLTYGKAVPPGRIGEPPLEVAEGLFFGAVPPPYRLALVGVEQTTPAVPAAGRAYALAHVAGEGGETSDEVLGALAATAAALGDTYHELGGGAAAVFASAAELADAILGAFVRRDPAFSPFGPGGAAAEAWPTILVELARLAYSVEVVHLVDADGLGRVTLEATLAAAAALGGRQARVALLMDCPGATYPVTMLNPGFYPRVAPEDRWMAARRTFEFPSGTGGGDAAGADDAGGAPADADADADAVVVDQVAAVVRDALSAATKNGAGPAAGASLDLGVVTRYAAAQGAFAIESRLVDLHDRCYGVTLAAKSGAVPGLAYFPLRRSAHPVDGTPTVFGPRPPMGLPEATLRAAIKSFNRYLLEAKEPYAPISPAATLVDREGAAAGFATAAVPPLYFFHDPGGAPAPGAATIPFPYDSRDIDEAIAAGTRRRPAEDLGPNSAEAVGARAAAAGHRNRLYKLFLAEFSGALRADRDAPLRADLSAAIASTRFESTRSAAALRRRLAEVLHDHPGDLSLVREAIARAYATSPQDPGRAAIEAIEATTFGFDRKTLARLRALGGRAQVVEELRAIMANRVAAVGPGEEGVAANMHVACSELSAGTAASPACVGPPGARRLAVPAARLEEFYSILAADILNPGKTTLLSSLSAGAADALDFVRRQGEHLKVSPAPGR